MRYFSTNQQAAEADFRTATITGQPADKGLYFPAFIPDQVAGMPGVDPFWRDTSLIELGRRALQPYVGDSLPNEELERLVQHAISFPIPLKQITDRIFSLELFHGPTLAFKDVGARFMSQSLGYFLNDQDRRVTVLVATSGDTGGAVADGFFNVDGVEVVILYPSGKVSAVQEAQLTTLGGNVTALEVAGTFDDCQRLVKQAFADPELAEQYYLTSANSINIARWLPQQLYFLQAARIWESLFPGEAPVISVPSGNFGNLSAGVLAWASGMPANHFIAACNANRTVPDFLATGTYAPRPAIATLSNAMDVGDPSNFVRLQRILEARDAATMLSAQSVSDAETQATMRQVWQAYGYMLDPHGAVAFRALEDYLDLHPGTRGYILETAHPVKFADVVTSAIEQEVPLPERLRVLLSREKQVVPLTPDYGDFKRWMQAR